MKPTLRLFLTVLPAMAGTSGDNTTRAGTYPGSPGKIFRAVAVVPLTP
jgi:hypothetical protein